MRCLRRQTHRAQRGIVDIIQIHVFRGLCLEAAFFQSVIDQLLQAGIDHDEHRHAQQHADKAEQTAAEQDGKHDPEAVDTGGAAEDLRSDDVAVDLLQDEDKDDIDQALHR